MHPGVDQRNLRERAYPDSTNLRARSSIYAYQQPQIDLHGFLLGLVPWEPGHRVLDVGCGPGAYLARLAADAPDVRAAGLDLSDGMAREASAHAPTLVGDVCHLPVASASLDRVLAPHMLYHAPDLDLAVSELRRVLRPGGVLLALTNGRHHLDGFARLVERASGVERWFRFADRFTIEDGGELLARHFDQVDLHPLRGVLVVPDVEPVVRYARSCRTSLEPQLAAAGVWEHAMARFEELVAEEIATTGAFRSTTESGVFVCR